MASGIAISVVLVLLAAWAIFFFRNIQRGSQQLNIGAAQDQFMPGVTQANQQLQQEFGSTTQQFRDIRDQMQGGNGEMQTQQMQYEGTQTDQFGTQGPTY